MIDTGARIQIWGKGFRVSADSEEFQRLAPREPLRGLEGTLDRVRGWGAVLKPLYAQSAVDASRQSAVVFSPEELLATAYRRTEDRFGRPSVVIVSVCTGMAWEAAATSETVSCALALAHRLAAAYATEFAGNPSPVSDQLRDGSFLPRREFELRFESPYEPEQWRDIIAAVARWKGVTGVATLRLMGLGANVLIGTEHEAERARIDAEIDGFYDVRSREIRPLTHDLVPWPAKAPAVPLQPAPDEVAVSMRRLDATMDRLIDVVKELTDAVLKNTKRR